MRDHRVTSLLALALAVALALALAPSPAPAHGHQLALRFDFRGDIETRVETRRAGCEADVLAHFTALVSSRDREGFRDEFERGVRLAWVCSTIAVKRPCGIGGLMTCDKRECFGSLLAGGDGEHACSFTDDDYLGFKAVEASVHDRFQRELAERQMEIAESTRSAIATVGYAVSDVGVAMANVSDQQTVLLAMGDEMLTKQDELSDQQTVLLAMGDEMLTKQDQLSDQQDKLSDQQDKLSDQQDKLSDQQDKLSDQQDKLSDQQGRMMGRIKAVMDVVDVLFDKVTFVLDAVERMEKYVEFWAANCQRPWTRWPKRRATSPSRS